MALLENKNSGLTESPYASIVALSHPMIGLVLSDSSSAVSSLRVPNDSTTGFAFCLAGIRDTDTEQAMRAKQLAVRIRTFEHLDMDFRLNSLHRVAKVQTQKQN